MCVQWHDVSTRLTAAGHRRRIWWGLISSVPFTYSVQAGEDGDRTYLELDWDSHSGSVLLLDGTQWVCRLKL